MKYLLKNIFLFFFGVVLFEAGLAADFPDLFYCGPVGGQCGCVAERAMSGLVDVGSVAPYVTLVTVNVVVWLKIFYLHRVVV